MEKKAIAKIYIRKNYVPEEHLNVIENLIIEMRSVLIVFETLSINERIKNIEFLQQNLSHFDYKIDSHYNCYISKKEKKIKMIY